MGVRKKSRTLSSTEIIAKEVIFSGLNLCFTIATGDAFIIDFSTANLEWLSIDIKDEG